MRCHQTPVVAALLMLYPLTLLTTSAHGAERPSHPATDPKLVVVRATARTTPPDWALMERLLMKTMDEAAPVYLRQSTFRGGTLREGGKLDDDYEAFGNWPLYYALGGDEKILDWSLQQWNAITRQWSYQRGSIDKEFVKHYDMLHLSEGYVGFQYFGLADPYIPENQARARRFAGFYLNEDPEAPNYDSIHKLIRSPMTGSKGPLFHADPQYTLNYGHASLYPLVKELEAGWEQNPKRREEIQRLYDNVVLRGDVIMNLAVTGLVTNAFLYTGDDKYKLWVLEYVNAWLNRIRENGGIIPDNIGLNGKIGEDRNGQWWGGFFGWSGRYSVEMIFNALITASECAQLVSGDSQYLSLLRSQIDILFDQAITREGDLLVPYKYGPRGWEDFRPMEPHALSHLWHASMLPADWERLEKLRHGSKTGPLPYAKADSPHPPLPGSETWQSDGTPIDWNRVVTNIESRNQHRYNEPPHLRYLAGQNPGWPAEILGAEYGQVCRTLDRIRSGSYEHQWKSQTVLNQNPIFTNGLTQVTLGAPHTCFNGGLLRAQVRYFDVEKRRPGLPQDVAVLVEGLESDRTILQLVNLNAFHQRDLIVQAGAFGEHQFTEVTFWQPSKDKTGKEIMTKTVIPIERRFFTVELPPSTQIRLEIGTRRFVNRPSYAFPWDSEVRNSEIVR